MIKHILAKFFRTNKYSSNNNIVPCQSPQKHYIYIYKSNDIILTRFNDEIRDKIHIFLSNFTNSIFLVSS